MRTSCKLELVTPELLLMNGFCFAMSLMNWIHLKFFSFKGLSLIEKKNLNLFKCFESVIDDINKTDNSAFFKQLIDVLVCLFCFFGVLKLSF